MIGEKNENLFEELDFTSFVDELGLPGEVEPSIENTEEEIIGSEIIPQEEQSSEDAESDSLEEEQSSSQENTNENSSPLTPYAKLLVEEGILPNLDISKFNGTAEGLKEAMISEIDNGINLYKEGLPDNLKQIIDNYEEGVPLSVLLEIDDRRFQYKSIKDNQIKEDSNLQKSIIRDFYKQTSRFTDEKIEKLIQRSEDLEELEEESRSSLTELIKLQDVFEKQEVEKARQRQIDNENKRQETLNTFKTTLEKKEEIIPGIKVSKLTKESIYKIMTTPVGADENGNPYNKVGQYKMEHPFEFDILLSYLYDTTKGFKDWSALSKAGKNKAIENFEEVVKKQEYRSSSDAPKMPKQTGRSIIDEIANLKF
jgi:hypothetical protein